jgi:Methyltransferase domain
MNTSKFIAQCREQWPDFEDSSKLALYEHPLDRNLSPLPAAIQGMATENKLMLLNLAVRNLASDEVYVEIGCWKGLSLAGAASGNVSGSIYACDDFSEFSGSLTQLDRTIQEYTAPEQVRFYDMDFRSFLALAPWQPSRIGVYFYDGGHTFEEQYLALEQVLPWLADRAVVIIDDTNAGQVRAANKRLTSLVPGFKLLADVQTPGNEFPTWWNGVQVYSYECTTPYALPKSGSAYHASRWFWDAVVPRARQILHAGRALASTVPGLRALRQYFRRQLARRSL